MLTGAAGGTAIEWAGLVAMIVVALIGAYGVIRSSTRAERKVEQATGAIKDSNIELAMLQDVWADWRKERKARRRYERLYESCLDRSRSKDAEIRRLRKALRDHGIPLPEGAD